MIKVERAMLQAEYDWQQYDGQDPTTVKYDRSHFNRNGGYEMLVMIQRIVNHFEYEFETDVHYVEDVIHNKLPAAMQSQEEVLGWLTDNLA